MIFSTSLKAATRTTVSDGLYNSASNWNCSCVPSSSDDIVINHRISTTSSANVQSVKIKSGAYLEINSGTFTVAQSFKINAGGEFKNKSTALFKGDYILNGVHSGTGLIKLQTGGNISGVGSFTNTKGLEIKNGDYSILVGSNLDLSSASITLRSYVDIQNYGQVTIYRLLGNGTNHWHNRSGAILDNEWYITPGMHIDAEYTNNTVIYSRPGTSNQYLIPADDGYYNLILSGTGLTSKKKPTGDLRVINDLDINNVTFDVKKSTIISDVHVGGDWNNNGGRFTPRTGTVTFNGTGSVHCHTGLEGFFDVVCSGAPRLETDIAIESEIFISNQLLAQGNDIYVEGDWTCIGDYVGDEGSVVFQGISDSYSSGATNFDNVVIDKTSPAKVIASGTMNVYETLSMDNGVLTTNDNVVIASNAAGTGRLGVMGSATFNGDLVVERYMSFAQNGWHLIGAGVNSMSIAEWNDDFITTGFTGADWPSYSFCSITKYDETLSGHKDIGVSNITSAAESVTAGEGRRAYIAAGENKLSVKGPAITGPFSWGLTYTPSGSSTDDGWNLVSNPYASTIDWDDTGNWSRSGLNDAIYAWVSEDEQYSSYIAGVGTNGGSRYIPSSQAFWVQTDAMLPTMSIVEDVKVDEEVAFKNLNDISYFKIQMTTSNNKEDEIALRIDENATSVFDNEYDAHKLRSANANLPSIALRTDDYIETSIYSFAEVNQDIMIPMVIHVGFTGDVAFSMTDFENFPDAERCMIFDALSDEYHQLRTNESVVINLSAGDYENRFFVVLTPGLNNSPDRSLAPLAGHKVWSAGETIFLQNSLNTDSQVDLNIYNAAGQLLVSEKGILLQNIYRTSVPAGSEGVLIVELIDLVTGETTVERIVK